MHITHVCTLEQIVQQNTIKVEYRPSSGKTSKQGRDTKLKENLLLCFCEIYIEFKVFLSFVDIPLGVNRSQ